MAIKTLNDLFIHALSDIYSAEKQLTKALKKQARASTSTKLKAAFETHLEETHGQIERIDQAVEATGIKLKRIKCVAMEGLIEEAEEEIGQEIQPSGGADRGDGATRVAFGFAHADRPGRLQRDQQRPASVRQPCHALRQSVWDGELRRKLQ